MQLSVRVKLIWLLVLVGVLPTLAALALVLIGGGRMRTDTLGQKFLWVAQSQAGQLEMSLRDDTEKLLLTLENDLVRQTLHEAGAVPADPVAAAAMDSRWAALPSESPQVQATLDNPAARVLQFVCQFDPACREILLTDTAGRLVAATEKTSDYLQSDEAWWQEAYAGGLGAIAMQPIGFDESSGAWSIDVAVPVYGDLSERRNLLGIAKAVVDLDTWMAQAAAAASEVGAEALLLRENGTVAWGGRRRPFDETIDQWQARLDREPNRSWYIAGDHVRAYSALQVGDEIALVPVRTPQRYLMVQMPRRQALAPVYRLGGWVAAAGLALTALSFGLGVYGVTRNLVRPIRRLRHAADLVAVGDLSQRVSLPRRIGSQDELGQLVQDFNRMVEAIGASQAAMQTINETKSRFVSVAGHELRTPVTYILGMTALLERTCQDPQTCASLHKIGQKAQRLDRIIAQMFQLLTDGRYAAMVRLRTFGVRDLVERVADELQPFLAARRQTLVTQGLEDAPPVRADFDNLHDALANLVNNAVKFTPDGGTITIAVRRLVGARVAIRVHDQCGGIPHEEVRHLFEPFWGGTDLLTHSTGQVGYQKRGAGLGLAVARHFAELHGGEITVGNLSEGCAFSLVLPTEESEEPAGAAAGGDTDAGDAAG